LEEPELNEDISLVYGRGFRERNKVDYNDGLTDKQWERVIERGEDVAAASAKKRKRRARKDDNGEDSDLDDLEDEEEDLPKLNKKVKIYPVTNNSSRRTSPPAARSSKSKAKGKQNLSSEDEKMIAIWDVLKKYAEPDGRVLSVLFVRLPSKKEYPDYYNVIVKPIDMQKIRSSINNGKYRGNLEQFVQDMNLLFNNAQEYNMPGSQVFNDAVFLLDLFKKEYKKAFEDTPMEEAPVDNDEVMSESMSGEMQDEESMSGDAGSDGENDDEDG